MIQAILHASNEKISKESKIHQYKHPVRVNENIAIGLFKEKFIRILLETTNNKREKKLIELQETIEKFVVPIRMLKSKDRKHNLTNKYKNNQKSSF